MKPDIVIFAQHGDKGSLALIAAEIADRFLAVARRILRDIDLAEDATQQALLAIWQRLPQLRDPARFDAWSYRLLGARLLCRGSERASLGAQPPPHAGGRADR